MDPADRHSGFFATHGLVSRSDFPGNAKKTGIQTGAPEEMNKKCCCSSSRLPKMDSGLFVAWSNTSKRVLASPRKTGMTLVRGLGYKAGYYPSSRPFTEYMYTRLAVSLVLQQSKLVQRTHTPVCDRHFNSCYRDACSKLAQLFRKFRIGPPDCYPTAPHPSLSYSTHPAFASLFILPPSSFLTPASVQCCSTGTRWLP